jgi:hypothetical protein
MYNDSFHTIMSWSINKPPIQPIGILYIPDLIFWWYALLGFLYGLFPLRRAKWYSVLQENDK